MKYDELKTDTLYKVPWDKALYWYRGERGPDQHVFRNDNTTLTGLPPMLDGEYEEAGLSVDTLKELERSHAESVKFYKEKAKDNMEMADIHEAQRKEFHEKQTKTGAEQ